MCGTVFGKTSFIEFTEIILIGKIVVANTIRDAEIN